MRQAPLWSHTITAPVLFDAIRIGLLSCANRTPPRVMPAKKIATTVKNIPPLFRREGLGPRSCLSKSSQSRWSMEDLLYGKCPTENAHKRPAFRFCRLVATFEKLIHKS